MIRESFFKALGAHLHVAVESDAADVAVAVESGSQSEGLGHGSTGSDGASFAGFDGRHALVVVPVDQRDLDVLHHGHHDALDRFLRFVLNIHIEADGLVVIEELAFQSELHVELAARESEAFGNHGARLLGAGCQRSVLHLVVKS